MRTLVLGSERAVAGALLALPPHLDVGAVALPSNSVELLRIRRVARMLRRYRPDFVVNLLRPHEQGVDQSTEERITRLCDEGIRNLASLCTAREARLLHLSTDQVFAGAREGVFGEDDVPAPVTAAGAHARLSELAVLHEPGSPHLVLRTGWVMGDAPGDCLAKVFAAVVAGRDPIEVAEAGPVFPVAPADLARVIATVLHQVQLGCETSGYFHYSVAEGVSWHDFVSALLELRRKVTGAPRPVLATAADGAGFEGPAAGAALGCRRLLRSFGVRQRNWLGEMERALAVRFAEDEPAAAAGADRVAEGG